jgi:hypothetical protein
MGGSGFGAPARNLGALKLPGGDPSQGEVGSAIIRTYRPYLLWDTAVINDNQAEIGLFANQVNQGGHDEFSTDMPGPGLFPKGWFARFMSVSAHAREDAACIVANTKAVRKLGKFILNVNNDKTFEALLHFIGSGSGFAGVLSGNSDIDAHTWGVPAPSGRYIWPDPFWLDVTEQTVFGVTLKWPTNEPTGLSPTGYNLVIAFHGAYKKPVTQ